MFNLSSRRHCPSAILSSLAAALLLSTLAGGCTDRDSSPDGTASRSSAAPTSEDLFLKECASCHGADGSGNGPLAAGLKVAPINLRLLTQSNNGRFPSRDLQRAIDGRAAARAHGLPDMPVWGHQWIREGLNDAERKARAMSIASYISTLQD